MQQFSTREEFLKSRVCKIGASDAPIIMLNSPYNTPYQLWRLKLGLDKPKDILPHMQKGLDIEDEARNYFYSLTGIKVFPYQIQHSKINYMISSLDGIDFSGKNILEIKKPCLEDHEYVKKHKKPPKKYFPQLQHQLECANLNNVYYLSFYQNDPVLIEVERDEEYIKSLLSKEAQFYKSMIELTPPALTDKDYIKRDDEDWIKENSIYLELKNKIHNIKKENDLDKLENELENSKNRLIKLSNGQNCYGNGIKLTKVLRKGVIDYNLIPELINVDLDEYRKPPTEYYKIG